MGLKFYNTLTRKKESFNPIKPGKVKLYTCGPTVYNYAHIGNFRAYMFEDLLHRYLEYKGFKVTHIMNLTDIDDKIIRDSNKEQKSITEFTKPYKKSFFDDLDALGIKRADYYPPATEHIPEMVAMIKTLMGKKLAYKTEDGSIYFKVDAFPKYGQLANLNIEDMQRGQRVENDEYEKQELRDFALWKGWKKEDGSTFWETEVGKGRPGWHIECSAMSIKYLGKHFDIHCGGVDNIFPHHENEIAQSEATTGEKFVNYWLHCKHLIVEGEKMSKSLGNFYNLRQLIEKDFSADVIRWTLLSTHYRQELNFTFEKLGTAQKSISRIRDFYSSLEKYDVNQKSSLQKKVDELQQEFENCLDDDLNISGALGAVFTLIKEINVFRQGNTLSKEDAIYIKKFVEKTDSILNILSDPDENVLQDEEQKLLDERNQARTDRNWAEADRLRDILLEKGIVLRDGPEGTIWKRK